MMRIDRSDTGRVLLEEISVVFKPETRFPLAQHNA